MSKLKRVLLSIAVCLYYVGGVILVWGVFALVSTLIFATGG